MAASTKLEQEVKRWRGLKSQAQRAGLKGHEKKIDKIVSILEELIQLKRGGHKNARN